MQRQKCRKIDSLYWDDENIKHISKHNVNPQEVEDVCFGTHIIRREGDQRYILSGKSANGRYLHVVIERVSKELFRPITAFEMSENYKRKYRKRLRN